MKTIDDFLKEYSPNDLLFNDIDYRRGARISGHFGVEEGYTMVNGEPVFDTIRIHTGVDRSGNFNKKGETIENIVISPFNFNRSNRIFYGDKISYGNLVQLFSDDYEFEMRIAHMNPDKDILPEIKFKLDKKQAIKRNEILGKSGNFGLSGGIHTHTEFLSLHGTCKTFDDLLVKIYGVDEVFSEYTKIDILKMYQNKQKWIGKSAEEILANFENLKKERGIISINKYKYQYKESVTNIIRTRYSSELLFNGL
jgi:murein DD-endopeptidase MepM/ murein hydrolase activator NlpD